MTYALFGFGLGLLVFLILWVLAGIARELDSILGQLTRIGDTADAFYRLLEDRLP
jgi:hypothetical protein